MIFESIEIRKVCNGVIVTLRREDDNDEEYVYDSDRKAMRFIKELLDLKMSNQIKEK